MINKNKVALTLAVLIGGLHLLWSLLVWFGWAQELMNWIYGMHFLNNPFTVAEFNFMGMIWLVIMTFVCGYIIGWIFSWLWAKFNK